MGVAILRGIHLQLTTKCNLSCKHCYARAGEPRKFELSKDQWVRIINEIPETVKHVDISGGEILTRPDSLELAYQCSKLVEKVHILTNGTLINNEKAREISKISDSVFVSVDGIGSTHDRFRNSLGSFAKTIKGIRLLIRAGVTPTVNVMLHKPVIDELRELILFLASEGIKDIRLARVAEIGNASVCEYGRLESDSFHLVARILSELKSSNNAFIDLDINMALRDKRSATRIKSLCGASSERCAILSDGRVTPCAALSFDEFVAGNVLDGELIAIWENPGSRQFKRLRGLTTNDVYRHCGKTNCQVKGICRGGCRAAAFIKTGRIDMPDPNCCRAYAEVAKFINA